MKMNLGIYLTHLQWPSRWTMTVDFYGCSFPKRSTYLRVWLTSQPCVAADMQSSDDDQIPAIVKEIYLITSPIWAWSHWREVTLKGTMIFSLRLDFNVSYLNVCVVLSVHVLYWQFPLHVGNKIWHKTHNPAILLYSIFQKRKTRFNIT